MKKKKGGFGCLLAKGRKRELDIKEGRVVCNQGGGVKRWGSTWNPQFGVAWVKRDRDYLQERAVREKVL